MKILHIMILDDESIASKKNISDQTLIEILNGGKSYPRYFVEKAKDELINRKINLDIDYVQGINNLSIVNYKNWISKNKTFILLIFFTAVASGLIGFFVVIVSIIISLNPKSRTDRNKRWNYINIALATLSSFLILIAYLLMS